MTTTSILLILAGLAFSLLCLIGLANLSKSLTEIKSTEYQRHQIGFYE
jgi:hypothetical protein